MGQKIHPLGFRVGISKQHSSIWYSKPKSYLEFLKEDIFVRKFLKEKFVGIVVSNIEIKRKLNYLEINVTCSKPSVVIDIKGSALFDLREALIKTLAQRFLVKRDIAINIVEIINPDSNSKVLADFICQQLERRVPFRKVMKAAILRAQKAGVRGVKIQIAGRLNGAEIARTEWIREGQVPLHTIKANIDYCNYKAQTLYGILGVKVWIYII
uniref:Small ribosomal subunit protein uS3c n=1 Tax=Cryptoglena skujai TaxID=161229 RepID=A0A0G3SKF8_9EUGL|nr:ribosomal protein S3 [Cryptoglena skujai]AKL39037.1 ribosomal protein S3 [Cryptoglena skujai]